MPKRNTHRRAFTFAELIMGLLITSLVGSAAAAVSLAVAQGWERTDPANQQYIARSRSMRTIERVLRTSLFTGVSTRGAIDGTSAAPAELLLWRNDINGDGQVQTEEVALLRHDPTSRTLVLHEVSFASAAQRSTYNLTWDPTWWTDPASPGSFRAQPFVVARVLARDVAGAEIGVLNPDDATQLPCVDVLLTFQANDLAQAETYYASAAIRSPRDPWE